MRVKTCARARSLIRRTRLYYSSSTDFQYHYSSPSHNKSHYGLTIRNHAMFYPYISPSNHTMPNPKYILRISYSNNRSPCRAESIELYDENEVKCLTWTKVASRIHVGNRQVKTPTRVSTGKSFGASKRILIANMLAKEGQAQGRSAMQSDPSKSIEPRRKQLEARK